MNSATFDTYTLVLLLVLAVILPLIGIWDFKRLLRQVEQKLADARTPFYIWTMVMEWGLVLGFAGYWIVKGRGLEPLGLVPSASGWQWLTIGLGIAATLAIFWNMVTTIRSTEKLDKARDEIGSLVELAPQSARELHFYNAVAITAGVCEEIIYRGVLFASLIPVVGIWPAVALSSAVFGLGHAYQGIAGIGKTALIGLISALLTVFSGSLFVAMFLHVVIDLTSGRILVAVKREIPKLAAPEVQTS